MDEKTIREIIEAYEAGKTDIRLAHDKMALYAWAVAARGVRMTATNEFNTINRTKSNMRLMHVLAAMLMVIEINEMVVLRALELDFLGKAKRRK
jgi:hypothetical protein